MQGMERHSPHPSPAKRPSVRRELSKDLAEAARQLNSCRTMQTVAALAFLCGAVWAVTLVGLGTTGPLAQFQRTGGRRALAEYSESNALGVGLSERLAAAPVADASRPAYMAGLPTATAKQPVPEALRRLIVPWDPMLTADDVRRGLSYYGTGKRMQAVAAKLLAGKPVKVFTLGGSVTKGQGASAGKAAYPARLFEFINTTFPHPDHTFVNKGVGATSSGIFTACVEKMVEPDADLVVIELTINEHPVEPFKGRQRQGYEQLIRKLLKLPGRPAVVQMHHFAWWRAEGDGVGEGLFYFPQAEEQLTVMSQYYDVPSVSLRAAVYPLMQKKIPGFRADKIWNTGQTTMAGDPIPVAEPKEKPDFFYYDRSHPNDYGHQVIAELLGSVLAKAVDEEQLAGCQPVGWAEPRNDVELREIPPPMVPGNADAPTTLCAMQEEFEGVVTQQGGFRYKPERPQEETFVGQKWGWTSEKPGSWLILEFDSRPDANAPARFGNWASVYLSHLKSYAGMGTAAVTCVEGCQCDRTILDGTWEQQATLMQIHSFKVTQHEQCRVKVKVLRAPGAVKQQGHKVTLMALMVSHYPLRLDTYERTAEEFVAKLGGEDDADNVTPGLDKKKKGGAGAAGGAAVDADAGVQTAAAAAAAAAAAVQPAAAGAVQPAAAAAAGAVQPAAAAAGAAAAAAGAGAAATGAVAGAVELAGTVNKPASVA